MEDVLVQKPGSTARFDITNYTNLQNLMRKDPESYKEEFLFQLKHFDSLLELLLLTTSNEALTGSFIELVSFLCHVSYCYPGLSNHIPLALIKLLRSSAFDMSHALRKCLVQNLILLHHRSQILSITELYSLFFDLFSCQDKNIRSLLYSFLVNDIKAQNHPQLNEKLNRILKSYLVKQWTDRDVTDKTDIIQRLSLRLMIELYHRNIWTDEKTINYIGLACFSSNVKISVQALSFFTGTKPKRFDDDAKENSGKEDESPEVEKRSGHASSFDPYTHLHDPQGFTEKLFAQLKASNESFKVRLLMMNVISRLIGFHKLILEPFYSYLLRFLRPSQPSVTHILAYAAQASHEFVPSDTLQQITSTIMRYFVAEYCSNEIITIGLNAIRAIAVRNTSGALDSTSLSYILDFKSYKNKGVVMATRSILTLYRERLPSMLSKRDRGRAAAISLSKKSKLEKQLKVDAESETVEENLSSQIEMDSNSDDQFIEDEEEDNTNNERQDSLEEEGYESINSICDGNEDISAISNLDDILDGNPDSDIDDVKENEEEDIFVSPERLESGIRYKQNAAERLAHVKAGRDDRKEKYAYKQKKLDSGAGSSNVEKKKTKNFLMMRHKRGGRLSRQKPSLRQKAAILKKQQGIKRRK